MSSVPQSPSLWALLVGVDEYAAPGIRALGGCVHDVTAMREFLVRQMGVPAAQVRVLTNAEATRARVLAEFESFLIANPDVPPGAQLLFQFSGHGSQMRSRDPGEADARDETILAHDCRCPGVFDIPDKTLAALLERLAAAKGDQITVILDCCHSGSGTRAPRTDDRAAVRRVEADDREPPADLDASLRPHASTRSAGGSRWAGSRRTWNHVLLAGCRDREESHEYRDPTGPAHGAMTFFLLDALRRLAPGTTYGDLHLQVSARLNALYRDQMPQCEGQRSRVVFGGERVERDLALRVIARGADRVRLDAGSLVPGLEVGAILTADDGVRLEVTTAAPDFAEAKRAAGGALPEVGVRVMLAEPVHRGTRRRVRVDIDRDPDSACVEETLRRCLTEPSGPAGALLELVARTDAAFDLRVAVESGMPGIFGPDGAALVTAEEVAGDTAEARGLKVYRALQAIARCQTIGAFTNPKADSRIQGRLRLRLLRPVANGPAQELPDDATREGGEISVPFHPDEQDRGRNLYVIEVVNASAVEVYPHVFILNPDFSIARLYPNQGQQNAVAAIRDGQPGVLQIGTPASGEPPLDVYLPEDPRWESARDQLLLIATTAPPPGGLDLLVQAGLEVPAPGERRGAGDEFANLLESVASGQPTRFARPASGAGAVTDWGTASLPFRVVRAAPPAEASSSGHDLGMP